MHVTNEDFETAAKHSNIRRASNGQLDFLSFESMIRAQLWHYAQRKVSDALVISSSGPENLSILSTLKFVLLNSQDSRETATRIDDVEKKVVTRKIALFHF